MLLFTGRTRLNKLVTVDRVFDKGFNCARYFIKIDGEFLYTAIAKYRNEVYNYFLELVN
jgi:hypothetical protein